MSRIIMNCDGACRDNQSSNNIGAWAYSIEYKDFLKERSEYAKNTTNNIMELKACIEGLKSIKIKNIPVDVRTDSNYVLQGITTWIKDWKENNWKKAGNKPLKNKELWIELDNLVGQFSDITFIKVKGHSGDEGNERVDYLCNVKMDELERSV